jgi:ATP-dependent Clp protease ATP-binding subunit ClpC
VLAQDEARLLSHNYIGTEHLLLGLLREEEGLAARTLESLEVTIENVRARVVAIIGTGDEPPAAQIPFTPRAKKVLELALREAVTLGHNYIGTEHVLLAIVRVEDGIAHRILLELGIDAETVRNRVIALLGPRAPGGTVPVSPPRSKGKEFPYRPLVVGWLLFAGALGIGILIGWAIWG